MEKLRHFELGDRGLGGRETFFHALKGRPSPEWLMKPESHSKRESACKGPSTWPSCQSGTRRKRAGVSLWICSRSPVPLHFL